MLLSLFTGLAYSDVKSLTADRLQTFFDGNLWIITRRKKTNTELNIRLLDVPKRIIEKYKGLARDGHVFPVPSNCNYLITLKYKKYRSYKACEWYFSYLCDQKIRLIHVKNGL